MEEAQIKVSPEAIDYFKELEDEGLAFGARDKWRLFIDAMDQESETYETVIDILSDLDAALSPAHWRDLPWKTITEMQSAMAPKPLLPPRPAYSQPTPQNADEYVAPVEAPTADEPISDALELKLQREELERYIAVAHQYKEKLETLVAQAVATDVPAAIGQIIVSRKNQFESLSHRSTKLLQEGDEADAFKALNTEWVSLQEDIDGLVHDMKSDEALAAATCDVKFPFDEPREGQLEAAIATRDALVKSDAVVNAPTGFGKSALVVSSVSGFEAGAYIVTPQKVLVDQYRKDFDGKVKWIGFLKARGDFKCVCGKAKDKRKGKPEEEWPTCSDMSDACELTSAKDIEIKHQCPYIKQRDIAMGRPVVVMTAAMATTLMLYQSHRFPKRAVLAVDESQRLEDTLMSACTTYVQYGNLVRDGWSMESDPNDPDNLLQWPRGGEISQDEVKEWLSTWLRRAQYRLEAMKPDNLEGKDLKDYKRYKSLCGSLKMAFIFDNPEKGDKRRPHTWLHEEGNERYKQPEQFVVKPLSAQGMLDDIMGGAAARKLLVSATPGTPFYIKSTLGLKYEPTYLEFGTPFPKENRELVFLPTVKLSYRSKDADYDKMMKMIVRIAGSEDDGGRKDHANQKGIIHTVSNKLHGQIKDALRAAGMGWRIREVKGSYRRLETIDEFQQSTKPLIMLGPAITDGVSLKDDHCRWGIIPKIPWAPPEPSVVWRRDNIQDWYVFQAIMSIIQACGRNVRSKDDWAINYVLDSGFSSVLDRNGYLFPPWFAEAVVDLS